METNPLHEVLASVLGIGQDAGRHPNAGEAKTHLSLPLRYLDTGERPRL
ncbi:hypothetical protein [Arthrobacter sp. MA-N2]|nr:hypothetical protein [Arthrobacter sp. MA-N2]